MLFPDRFADPELVVCSDTVAERAKNAVDSFGFLEASAEWRTVVEHPDVDLVVVTAPNMLHVEIVEAAAAAGKHVFCEKPVGGTPAQTIRAADAARAAGVITGVGYNYRFAPLVQYARQLLGDGRLGEFSHYRGRFFSMYGADPLGVLSWRFLERRGRLRRLERPAQPCSRPRAHRWRARSPAVVADRATFIAERPLPSAGGTHYGRGSSGDPTGTVTNEDYVSLLVEFENGARGTFESSRALVGPESQMAFEVYGTGRRSGLEPGTAQRAAALPVGRRAAHGLHDRLRRRPLSIPRQLRPGSANGIGFEDLVAIEDFELLQAVTRGVPHTPSFEDAVGVVEVQDAVIRSWESGRWEDVVRIERS